jgi:hypothetical protein
MKLGDTEMVGNMMGLKANIYFKVANVRVC